MNISAFLCKAFERFGPTEGSTGNIYGIGMVGAQLLNPPAQGVLALLITAGVADAGDAKIAVWVVESDGARRFHGDFTFKVTAHEQQAWILSNVDFTYAIGPCYFEVLHGDKVMCTVPFRMQK